MKFRNFALLALIIAIGTVQAIAQCETWNDSPNKEYLEGQHSVYRSLVKTNDFEKALPVWKEV